MGQLRAYIFLCRFYVQHHAAMLPDLVYMTLLCTCYTYPGSSFFHLDTYLPPSFFTYMPRRFCHHLFFPPLVFPPLFRCCVLSFYFFPPLHLCPLHPFNSTSISSAGLTGKQRTPSTLPFLSLLHPFTSFPSFPSFPFTSFTSFPFSSPSPAMPYTLSALCLELLGSEAITTCRRSFYPFLTE
ncbi:MAG: hypothetical protein JOS17DRAFT_545433 [Linnemannia elongata]|nr:MAG: hypothetical protein JOS17DRAFT_545305 [Linnemannia elongata]KAK3808826.1 MAG: hypothetical protein JOS17DRAFT_545433 [Linnemannia elongata]